MNFIRYEESAVHKGTEPFFEKLKADFESWQTTLQRLSRKGEAERYEPLRTLDAWLTAMVPTYQIATRGLAPSYNGSTIKRHESDICPILTPHPDNPHRPYLNVVKNDIHNTRLLMSDGYHYVRKNIARRVIFHPDGPYAPARPPRHAQFHDGLLGRVWARDLAESVEAGERVLATVSARTGRWMRREQIKSVQFEVENDFIRPTIEVLECIHVPKIAPGKYRNPANDFYRTVSPWLAYSNTHVRNPNLLAVSFIECGLDYLREMQTLMPDYTESSGQSHSPQYSINISGGTVYGPVAMKLDAINSTIAGIVQLGARDVGEALRDLERAILADTQHDDELRQDLLDNLESLADAAQAPPEERKRGVIRSILSSFNAAATSGPQIAAAMESWGQILGNLA